MFGPLLPVFAFASMGRALARAHASPVGRKAHTQERPRPTPQGPAPSTHRVQPLPPHLRGAVERLRVNRRSGMAGISGGSAYRRATASSWRDGMPAAPAMERSSQARRSSLTDLQFGDQREPRMTWHGHPAARSAGGLETKETSPGSCKAVTQPPTSPIRLRNRNARTPALHAGHRPTKE